ncbi:MAG: SPOR domain-containing protein [Proteobacteria bacterium]|nr:SPOR domain-containing protein [Pseudomonadota bacterium]
MTARNTDATEAVEGEEDPRKQLLIRAGVAGGLIAALLAGLAVFDYVSRPPAPTEVPLPTRPIAPAQVTPEVGRDAPPDVLRAGNEAVAPESAPSQEESAPPMLPDGGVASDMEVPSRAMRSGRIGEVSRGVPPHAGAAAHTPAIQQPVPTVPAAAPTAATPAAGVVPHQPVAQEAPRPAPTTSLASRQAASAAPAAPAAPTSRQGPPVGNSAVAAPAAATSAPPSRPYVLEFGVFTSVASAEALRARLAQAGIPSQLETRVVVGPFADRKDALAAQARLREKGIDQGTLQPLGR